MDMPARIVLVLAVVAGLAGLDRAEFGFGVDATSYRANFSSAASPAPWRHDPGAAVAGVDHEYDDGFNRVDSSGNPGNTTTYWGYQNWEQYDPAGDGGNGTITMQSTRTVLNAGRSSAWQDGPPAGLTAYWQQELAGEGACVLGLRAALRWQHITVDERSGYGSTLATVADRYTLGGVLLFGAPYEGSASGPGKVLGDDPVRTESSVAGPSVQVRRALAGERVAMDLGPTLSLDLSERVRVVFLLGVTTVWLQSRFTYADGDWDRGSTTDQDWLVGGVAGLDLQYRLGANWGGFGGASASALQDFKQQLNGHAARVQLDSGVAVRAGLFFQY